MVFMEMNVSHICLYTLPSEKRIIYMKDTSLEGGYTKNDYIHWGRIFLQSFLFVFLIVNC